jgi:predicted NUDIX family phosphoesterase
MAILCALRIKKRQTIEIREEIERNLIFLGLINSAKNFCTVVKIQGHNILQAAIVN